MLAPSRFKGDSNNVGVLPNYVGGYKCSGGVICVPSLSQKGIDFAVYKLSHLSAVPLPVA